MRDEGPVRVQQRHEHARGVCADAVDLLARLLGHAAHDLLTAADGSGTVSPAGTQATSRNGPRQSSRPSGQGGWDVAMGDLTRQRPEPQVVGGTGADDGGGVDTGRS